MKKERGIQTFLIAILSIAVITMSIGFAVFSQNLDINGTATVKSAKWEIKFDSATYQETSGSIAATSKMINDTSMSYTITLNKPGDFYEFTINAKNYGTLNANLKSITMSSLSETESKFLTYTLSYGGNNYTTTTNNLSVALNAQDSSPVKVRVEYIQPINSDDLPQTDQTVNLTATLNYQQAS